MVRLHVFLFAGNDVMDDSKENDHDEEAPE
jgi:hypothetical protein